MARTDVTFRSGDDTCAGWLYRPEGEGPYPIMLLAHGFSGVREARLWAYAERFCAAVLAALVFDYRHFGASGGEPRQLRDELARMRGRPPYMLPVVGPPDTPAAMNSPDAEPGYRALFPPGVELRNEVAARIGLRIASYRPIRHASQITCPWLVCVGDD